MANPASATKRSIYWYDYETFGTDPKRDRPVQFAGIRTDEDLNIIGEPLMLFCRPANDMLPHPEACLVTGITPQQALLEGYPEAKFIADINREFAQPGTCVAGYNNIRFDDEFTRYTLYRNFFDPYAREWQHGNSRWDIIDMVRLTRALRPEGITWPNHDDGSPSYRLEDITAANGLSHEAAHDALSDVYATIAVAALIRKEQPRLYDYIYRLRGKHEVAKLLNVRTMEPVLHVSSMFPSQFGCLAMVVPLALHPTNKNGIIVYDLRHDPEPLLSLCPEEIRHRLYTPRDQLPEGVERIPLKTVHLNKCPIVVPMNTLSPQAAERWQIDVALGHAYAEKLKAAANLSKKLHNVFGEHPFEADFDPDHSLYSGGFFSDEDRRRMERVRSLPATKLPELDFRFDDPRLPEMLFRYRARNYPDTLNEEERIRWEEYRLARLTRSDGGGSITLDQYLTRIQELRDDPTLTEAQRTVLDRLQAYGHELVPDNGD